LLDSLVGDGSNRGFPRRYLTLAEILFSNKQFFLFIFYFW
jgi:hypothetical protein